MYRDGEVVVRQGEIGDCMFAILQGRVEVLQETGAHEVRVGIMGEGEIFGEMAIFEKDVRSATVRALGDARLLTIDKKTFLRRVQADPSIAFNLARLLCSRIRKLSAELAALRSGQG
jgi:CRP-like cAMP-binding protein